MRATSSREIFIEDGVDGFDEFVLGVDLGAGGVAEGIYVGDAVEGADLFDAGFELEEEFGEGVFGFASPGFWAARSFPRVPVVEADGFVGVQASRSLAWAIS